MNGNFVENSAKLSDDELVHLINSGEYEYLGVLIDRYMPLILKTVKRYEGCGCEPEDLIQEGTVAIFSAVRRYNSERASFPTFAELCVNRAVGTQARFFAVGKRIPDKLITPIDDVDISDVNSPEKIFIEKESYQLLTEDIRMVLSSLEYNVLDAYLMGMSYYDIAEKLGISVKSVDNSLKRIRTKLGCKQVFDC